MTHDSQDSAVVRAINGPILIRRKVKSLNNHQRNNYRQNKSVMMTYIMNISIRVSVELPTVFPMTSTLVFQLKITENV